MYNCIFRGRARQHNKFAGKQLVVKLFLLCAIPAIGQTRWSEVLTEPKKTYWPAFLHSDQSGMYAYKALKKSKKENLDWAGSTVIIDKYKYDANTLKREYSNPIQAPSYDIPGEVYWDHIAALGNTFVLITQIIDGQDNLTVLAHQLEKDGKASQKFSKLFDMKGLSKLSNSLVYLRPADNGLLSVHYVTRNVGARGAEFHYAVIDADLNVIGSKTIKTNSKYEYRAAFFDRNANHHLVQLDMSGKQYIISTYNKQGDLIFESPVLTDDKVIPKVYDITFDGETMYIGGLYTYKTEVDEKKYARAYEEATPFGFSTPEGAIWADPRTVVGSYLTEIDLKEKKIVSSTLTPFSEADIGKFISESKMERKGTDGMKDPGLVIRELILHQGKVLMVCEVENHHMDVIKDASGGVSYTYTFYNEHIWLISYDASSGKSDWNIKIPKKQFSKNDKGKYNSVFAATAPSGYVLIFNDHPDNLNPQESERDPPVLKNSARNTLMRVDVTFDGVVKKAVLDNSASVRFTKINQTAQFGGKIFLFSNDDNKFTFGVIALN